MATDIIVSEMTSATQINTNDLMIMTQPDLLAETGYSTKKGTVLQVANKMLKGTEYLTDLPDFTDKTVLGGLEELKGDLTALLPVNTASGSIANFDTDLSYPLVECKANIVATGGNGTSDSPIPVNGYSSANITRCGVNLFDKTSNQVVNGYFGGSGNISGNSITRTVYVKCKPNTTYTVSRTAGRRFSVAWFETVPDVGVQTNGNVVNNTASSITITTGATAKYLGAYVYNQSYDTGTADEMIASVQIAEGTDTTYHAYNGQTYAIAFGQTVYGGVLDVARGKLTVTWGSVDLGSLTWAYNNTLGHERFFANASNIKNVASNVVGNILCPIYQAVSGDDLYSHISDNVISVHNTLPQIWVYNSAYTDENIFKTAMDGILCTYELATPFDIELTPVQINALLGVNNVYNDTNGDTEVKYKEGIQHYIDKKIAATQALIL